MLTFISETMKHSAANAIATGEFVFNLCSRGLFEAMTVSPGDFAEGVDEFAASGLGAVRCGDREEAVGPRPSPRMTDGDDGGSWALGV